MKDTRYLFRIFLLTLLAGAVSAGAYGQAPTRQVEPSYEVSLQLIVGSNSSTASSEMPGNLSGISKHLKNSFTFSNYRLAGTFLGRVTNTGNFEYKSTTNMFGQESERAHPTFMDWTLADFRKGKTESGRQGFQAHMFRFGARVPIRSSVLTDGGKTNSVVNYEPIGLNLQKVGLAENSPTLIGTLNLPGADGTVFLVMTVRSADL